MAYDELSDSYQPIQRLEGFQRRLDSCKSLPEPQSALTRQDLLVSQQELGALRHQLHGLTQEHRVLQDTFEAKNTEFSHLHKRSTGTATVSPVHFGDESEWEEDGFDKDVQFTTIRIRQVRTPILVRRAVPWDSAQTLVAIIVVFAFLGAFIFWQKDLATYTLLPMSIFHSASALAPFYRALINGLLVTEIAHDSERYVLFLRAMALDDPKRLAVFEAYKHGFRNVWIMATLVSATTMMVSLVIKKFDIGKMLASKFSARNEG